MLTGGADRGAVVASRLTARHRKIRMTRATRPAIALLATTALALTLSACKIDNRPLLARGGPPPPPASAPPLGPLDPTYAPAAYATDAQLPVQDQAYAYPQRAYAMSRVVHQRPPSYAFAYGEEQPWVWDDGDDGTMFAEPIDDGYRYYYYEPGEDRPYFVQDPDYGYAYGPTGALIALFGVTGALIAADHYRDYAPRAEDYWSRGYSLDRAYRRSPRYPVQPAIWRQRAPALESGHDRWFRAASAQPAWREAAARGAGGPHGGEPRGRELAAASPQVRSFRPEARGVPGPQRAVPGEPGRHGGVHGPAQARGLVQAQAQPPHGPARGGGQAHGREPHGRQPDGGQVFARAAETHHGRAAGVQGPAQFRPAPQAHVQPRGPAGGHGHGPAPGGQAFAHAAETHGRDAGAHGPAQFRAPPQPHAQPQPHGAPQQHGPSGGGQHGGGQGGHGGGEKKGHDH